MYCGNGCSDGGPTKVEESFAELTCVLQIALGALHTAVCWTSIGGSCPLKRWTNSQGNQLPIYLYL
jgi:hypothetical protein